MELDQQREGPDDIADTAMQAASGEVRTPCPVVGIGASAGGLEVFQELFSRMPTDSGMAFVLVQHLDPRHETLMPELLSRHTAMPVQLVAEDTRVETDRVYVTPPNATVTIDDCTPAGRRGGSTSRCGP